MGTDIQTAIKTNIKPTPYPNTEIFQQLEQAWRSLNNIHVWDHPVDGQVARAEHVTDPLNEISRISARAQDLLGSLGAAVDVLDKEVQDAVQLANQTAANMRTEVNYWNAINKYRDPQLNDFIESFETPITLDISTDTNLLSQENSISRITFMPDILPNPASNGSIANNYYAFGDPFNNPSPADTPADKLRFGMPLKLQAITRDDQLTSSLGQYVQQSFENPNHLSRVDRGFIWHQDATHELNLKGRIVIEFTKPLLLSYIQLSSLPQQVFTSVSLIDEYGAQKQYPATSEVYFDAFRVKTLYLHTAGEGVKAKPLAYNLAAHVIYTPKGAYVYYEDATAATLAGRS